MSFVGEPPPWILIASPLLCRSLGISSRGSTYFMATDSRINRAHHEDPILTSGFGVEEFGQGFSWCPMPRKLPLK